MPAPMTSTLPTPTPAPSRPRPTFACIRCADRKVKCDKQSTCSTCVKHNVECIYNSSHSGPTRKRQKRVKDQILTDRLQYYEALLKEKGIDPARLPDTPPGSSRWHPDSTTPDASDHNTVPSTSRNCENLNATDRVSMTQVVHDQGRYKFVDNSLWTRVVEELQDPEDVLENSSNEGSDSEVIDDEFSYVLVPSHRSKKNRKHPPRESILQLWQIFLDNVDPLTKLVHVPTLSQAIQKAAENLEAIPKTFETLMFAIYSVAVMSLKDEDCWSRFGEPRKILFSRYVTATKAALIRAKFMGTTSLVVLQALILHILSVRDVYEPRSIWSLTGVAVRIAESMGLERDGTILGLPPFETEIRRRIWWLLKTHDFRTAELCGLAKFRDLNTTGDSTKWPTNINDDQIYPGMVSVVADTSGLTDLVFVAMRYDLANFAANQIARCRKAGLHPTQFHLHVQTGATNEMDKALAEAEELLETKYIRYCDPSQQLHLMVMITARFALNVVRFLSHHPRRWSSIEATPIAERRWVLGVAINLLEQHNMVLTNPQLKQFAWHAPYFQQWHALIHVIDTLRFEPLIPEAEKAWKLLASTYENTPGMISDTKKPIHVAVGNLCLKAYKDREMSLQTKNIPLPPTPQFILQLRQQREAAKAKRKAKLAKTNLADLSTVMESTNLQTSVEVPIAEQAKYDSFWYENGFDDNGLNEAMNMDLDFMLPIDQTMDDTGVTWDQWDVWLADSNLIPPSSS